MFERPITTACLPRGLQPIDSSIFMQPYGVQGLKPGWPTISAPALATWKPSTSLSGEMVSMTLCESMWAGSGNCTRMPWIVGSLFSASTRASNSPSDRLAGYCSSTECRPLSRQALTLLRT